MDQLDQVVLFHIATMLDLDNLLSLCSTNSRMNRLICQQNAIWLYKLNREFPDWKQHFNDKPVNKVYSLLIKLDRLRKELKYEESIYELFNKIELVLINKGIKILPLEIGSLTNLQYLYLNNNQIKTLPPEIGSLSNLQELYLHNKQIETLPPEIGSLSNLQTLTLSNNKIVTLPPEIGSLSNLQVLYLNNNQIETLPPEIGSLSNLQILHLDRKVENIPSNLKDTVYIN